MNRKHGSIANSHGMQIMFNSHLDPTKEIIKNWNSKTEKEFEMETKIKDEKKSHYTLIWVRLLNSWKKKRTLGAWIQSDEYIGPCIINLRITW